MSQKDKILSLIKKEDWDALNQLFLSMTNAEFRRIEIIMKDQVLPSLSNHDYWKTYLHLLMYRRQAFLACILSIERLAKKNELNFDCEPAKNVFLWLKENSPESVLKVVRMAVPLLTSEPQIVGFFRLFEINDEVDCVAILLKESTSFSYYALFDVLKRVADNRDLLCTAYFLIMKKNDDMSFNMASIIRSYFDLNEIKSTFSLHIEPYELSYIEQSYENFVHVLKGKRPRL